ncbi:unnamed protein product, partial [Darwinula stevensoni]
GSTMGLDRVPEFTALDYVVFGLSLLAALGVGLYFGYTGRKESHKSLIVSDGIHMIPVVLSLIASYLSAILLLGTPAEVYAYGSQWFLTGIGAMLGTLTACVIFVPFFYRLRITSIFQYFEMRYRSRVVRLTSSSIYLIQQVLYMTVALYAPVVAVSSVTPFPEWLAIIVAGGICTVYTAFSLTPRCVVQGGLKAAVWTDALQVFLMFGGVLLIVIHGTIEVGGIEEVWARASSHGRGQVFNIMSSPSKTLSNNVAWKPFPPSVPMRSFSFDVYERHTFWKLISFMWLGWMLVHGCNQPSLQRYSCMKNERRAVVSVLCNIPGSISLMLLAAFSGLVVFAVYVDCDPLKAGYIKKQDQIIPYYVMDKLSHLNGLPGIFLAALFSGALSTLSSGLNSLAAVTWTDGVMFTSWHPNLTDKQSITIIKVIGKSSH